MRKLLRNPEDLATRLRHILWIGGGSGAGKSTVTRRLSDACNLRLCHTDDRIAVHAQQARTEDTPLLQRFLAMDMDERWVSRSPTEMLKTFPWFAGEGFDLLVDELLALPEEPPLLVEGFRLLPRLVTPLLSRPQQAVWLAPTATFRRMAFARRGFTREIPNRTSQPAQALANLLTRDQLFTDEVVREATALHLRVIAVDGREGVEELTLQVARSLGLRLP